MIWNNRNEITENIGRKDNKCLNTTRVAFEFKIPEIKITLFTNCLLDRN